MVLYAAEAPIRSGAWSVETDTTAAGSSKLRHANAGAAKVSTALANPVNFFEMTFNAEPGRPYHLWVRGKADNNSWANDSVFVQFDHAVNSSGTSVWAIGSTSATEVNLEDCSDCGLSNWGWQDNGWGSATAMGQDVSTSSEPAHTGFGFRRERMASPSTRLCCHRRRI